MSSFFLELQLYSIDFEVSFIKSCATIFFYRLALKVLTNLLISFDVSNSIHFFALVLNLLLLLLTNHRELAGRDVVSIVAIRAVSNVSILMMLHRTPSEQLYFQYVKVFWAGLAFIVCFPVYLFESYNSMLSPEQLGRISQVILSFSLFSAFYRRPLRELWFPCLLIFSSIIQALSMGVFGTVLLSISLAVSVAYYLPHLPLKKGAEWALFGVLLAIVIFFSGFEMKLNFIAVKGVVIALTILAVGFTQIRFFWITNLDRIQLIASPLMLFFWILSINALTSFRYAWFFEVRQELFFNYILEKIIGMVFSLTLLFVPNSVIAFFAGGVLLTTYLSFFLGLRVTHICAIVLGEASFYIALYVIIFRLLDSAAAYGISTMQTSATCILSIIYVIFEI